MFRYTATISNRGILEIIRRCCNYIDPRLMDHGLRVSRIVFLLLKQEETHSREQLRDCCFLALLHDIGAYKTDEIDRMVQFETKNVWEHSIYGYLFAKHFSPLKHLAGGVLLHHTPWKLICSTKQLDATQRHLAQILGLADRVDVFLSMEQRDPATLADALSPLAGNPFDPALIARFLSLGIIDQLVQDEWEDQAFLEAMLEVPFSQEESSDYLQMMNYLIDFRSHYTVAHTITTTSISLDLAKLLGLEPAAQERIVCGALLHDLGKIGIPVEILEFPGKLSPQAMKVMRTHVDLTGQIFDGHIDPLVSRIATRHHEKLDGSGYPLGLHGKDLTEEERVVAVADIISALSGARSYKEAFPKERMLSILTEMRDAGQLDPIIVNLVLEQTDSLMANTKRRCAPVLELYESLMEEYEHLREEIMMQLERFAQS